MAVLSTCHEPSLGRPVHHEFMRSALLDVAPIIAATACHQRNYVERYSRYNNGAWWRSSLPYELCSTALCMRGGGGRTERLSCSGTVWYTRWRRSGPR